MKTDNTAIEGGNTNRPWYKTWWFFSIIAVIALILLVLSGITVYFLNILKNTDLSPAGSSLPTMSREELALALGPGTNHYYGAEEPQLTIVEFADFACPYCRLSFPKIRSALPGYEDKVRFIYRDFPIIADHSPDLALAARCAGEQDRFWPMHDKLYLNQGLSTRQEYIDLAVRAGADRDRFIDCYDSKKYLPQIQKDMNDAIQLGLSGTPVWFIGSTRVDGDIPDDFFQDLFEKLFDN